MEILAVVYTHSADWDTSSCYTKYLLDIKGIFTNISKCVLLYHSYQNIIDSIGTKLIILYRKFTIGD